MLQDNSCKQQIQENAEAGCTFCTKVTAQAVFVVKKRWYSHCLKTCLYFKQQNEIPKSSSFLR